MWQHGHFYWNELMCRDTALARDFYAGSLGWTFNEMPMDGGGSYWVAVDGELPIGGIFEMSGPDFDGIPDHWFAYIAVIDLDECVKKAQQAGGQLRREPFDVPNIGRIAILQQPGGAMIGWMTPAATQ